MIVIENLKFSYQSSLSAVTPVLDIPYLEIKKNEKVFLYGPSGSGKTTLLEILAGVLVPQSGQVIVDQVDIAQLSGLQRDHFRAHRMGYIFQSFNLLSYLSVLENILLPLKLSPQKMAHFASLKAAEEKAAALCQRLGIASILGKPVSQLSVGQQQRVAVARSLMGQPQVILADEPTSALDQEHREKFLKLLFEMCQEQQTTLVFVSHDRSIQALFDRAISIQDINKASIANSEAGAGL